MILVTAAEMRALDEATIVGLGVPGALLMEGAGRAVVEVIAARGPVQGRRVAVVCGAGNNGGDGYVIARHLHQRGAEVTALLVAGEPRKGGDARLHLDLAVRAGVRVLLAEQGAFSPEGAAAVDRAELIVDAILGTGAGIASDGSRRDVTGHLAEVIRHLNAAPGVRIAVDLPSGLDADRGHPLGVCVRADETVTFGFAKIGLVTSPGFTFAGRLTVADIGIPASLARERSIRAHLLAAEAFADLGAPRSPLAHKGTYGHLLVMAGSRQHPGAALMCAEASMRAGVGLCTVASSDEAERVLAQRVYEASAASFGPQPVGVDEGEAAWLRVAPLLSGKQAVAFGPGVARTPGMRRLLERLLDGWEGPLVIDADGLNLLAEDASVLGSTRAQVVLTPHPAEMARLSKSTTAAVQSDRVGSARTLAARLRAVVALKGARTVVASPDGTVAINPTGNPGMASGGTGDALTGTIGALLAGGHSPMRAACAGVFLHGRAGDLARDAVGEAGLLTRDLIARLPEARRSLHRP